MFLDNLVHLGTPFDDDYYQRHYHVRRGCYCVLVIVGGATTKQHNLTLLSLDVSAVAARPYASVHYEATFKNDSAHTGDAKFFLPRNPSAAVYELSAQTSQGLVLGVVKKKAQAVKEFAAAKAAGHTATLTTSQNRDTTCLNLANILANETIVVRWTEAAFMPLQGTEYRLTIPSHISPKYDDPNGLAENQAVNKNTTITIKAKVQADPGATSRPRLTVSDAADVSFGDGEVAVTKIGGLQTDFVLRVEYPAIAPVAYVAQLGGGGGGGGEQADGEKPPPAYEDFVDANVSKEVRQVVVASLTPVFPYAQKPLDVVVLVDRSGSMAGDRIQNATLALKTILSGLKLGDHFGIIGFGSTFQVMQAMGAYDNDSKDQASQMATGMRADLGGTELWSALESAIKMSKHRLDQGTVVQPAVIVLTDGDTGRLDLAKIGGMGVPIFTICIGEGASRGTCEAISARTGGESFYAAKSEKIAPIALSTLACARQPAVTDVRLEATDESGQVHAPKLFHEAFRGPEIVVAAAPVVTSFFGGGPAGGEAFTVKKHWPSGVCAVPNVLRNNRLFLAALVVQSAHSIAKVTLVGKFNGSEVRSDFPVTKALNGKAIGALGAFIMHRCHEGDGAPADNNVAQLKKDSEEWMTDVAVAAQHLCSVTAFLTIHPTKASGAPVAKDQTTSYEEYKDDEYDNDDTSNGLDTLHAQHYRPSPYNMGVALSVGAPRMMMMAQSAPVPSAAPSFQVQQQSMVHAPGAMLKSSIRALSSASPRSGLDNRDRVREKEVFSTAESVAPATSTSDVGTLEILLDLQRIDGSFVYSTKLESALKSAQVNVNSSMSTKAVTELVLKWLKRLSGNAAAIAFAAVAKAQEWLQQNP